MTTEKQKEQAIEVLVTAGLINAGNEQIEVIRHAFKHRMKQKVNLWVNMGNSIMNELKKNLSEVEIEILEGITDCYHEQSDSIRSQIKNK